MVDKRAHDLRKMREAKDKPPRKLWSGEPPETCQICQMPIHRVFVDGATRMGPWAIMCRTCHFMHGCGFGTGKGQKYERIEERDPSSGEVRIVWLKVEG